MHAKRCGSVLGIGAFTQSFEAKRPIAPAKRTQTDKFATAPVCKLGHCEGRTRASRAESRCTMTLPIPHPPATASEPIVCVVDDNPALLCNLRSLLESVRLQVQTYTAAQPFLEHFDGERPGCLLLDVRMPGMSGLALFEQLVQRRLTEVMPVIFLTGHADVPTAVDAVKRGAFDFCPKPFSDNALVDRIEQALQRSAEHLSERRTLAGLQSRVADLTERERDVMQRVVEGLPNKLIADQLNISVRTVEVHRARVFDKMEVKSAVELANMLRNL